MFLHPDRSNRVSRSETDTPLTELLRLVGQQAEEPFQQLYDRTSARVYTMALSAVHDTQRAERITAQVFVDVWWRCGEFDASAGSVESWLTLLTRARLIDDLRHSRQERPGRSAARTEPGSPAEAWVRSIRNGGRAIVSRAGVPASAA